MTTLSSQMIFIPCVDVSSLVRSSILYLSLILLQDHSQVKSIFLTDWIILIQKRFAWNADSP